MKESRADGHEFFHIFFAFVDQGEAEAIGDDSGVSFLGLPAGDVDGSDLVAGLAVMEVEFGGGGRCFLGFAEMEEKEMGFEFGDLLFHLFGFVADLVVVLEFLFEVFFLEGFFFEFEDTLLKLERFDLTGVFDLFKFFEVADRDGFIAEAVDVLAESKELFFESFVGFLFGG